MQGIGSAYILLKAFKRRKSIQSRILGSSLYLNAKLTEMDYGSLLLLIKPFRNFKNRDRKLIINLHIVNENGIFLFV